MPRAGAAQGVVLAAYLSLVPIVEAVRIRDLSTSPYRAVVITSGVMLSVFWLGIVARLVALVIAQLRGGVPKVTSSGLMWLATLIVTILSFSGLTHSPTSRNATSSVMSTVVSADQPLWFVPPTPPLDDGNNVNSFDARHGANHVSTSPPPPTAHANVDNALPLPLALMAKRRRIALEQGRLEIPDDEIDDAIELLRRYDPQQLSALRHVIGDRESGLLSVPRLFEFTELGETRGAPMVVVAVGTNDDATLVAFARPGSSLPLGDDGAALVDRSAVVLEESAQCRIATTPAETLRALALRASFDDVVVYLGGRSDLDDDVAARCVTIGEGPQRHGEVIEYDGRSWRFSLSAPAPAAYRDAVPVHVVRHSQSPTKVRVEILRAEVQVTGLVEAFAPTLRRRCVEMTAYLAVHHHEAVTGDRLRTRVLGRSDDASLRTLSNTASAVRRSLGADERGPRLHPVSPAGLYQTHDVGCDLVEFHQLVTSARQANAAGVAATLRRALELVQGEPLATALRGFEWFLAEGHLARLQRDGEWAALRLAAEARERDEFDLAFWAIEQGRLLDPYSEALEAALHRVPRLREFGGNGAGRPQDESVSAR